MFERAEIHLRRAIKRISADYTRPGNTEAYFQLGIALRAQDKFAEAYKMFYRATWDNAYHSAAFKQLAELSCIFGKYDEALPQIDNSLSTNNRNVATQNLKTLILRKLSRFEAAEENALETLKIDPLNFWAMNELYLLAQHKDKQEAAYLLKKLSHKMRGEVEAYLELALDYINLRQLETAAQILRRPIEGKMVFASTYPLIYYYLGYVYSQMKNEQKTLTYFKQANEKSSDYCFYCFPFRLETIKVLKTATEKNPRDAKAFYYLGNLLFDLQPEKAIKAWQRSSEVDASFSLVHRNLGWGYYRQKKDISKAILSYEKAVSLNNKDPKLFVELDQLYEVANVHPQKRLELLVKNHDVVSKRNDSFLREIMNLVLVGEYDKAIAHLAQNHFHIREGGGEVHTVFVDAHLLRGLDFYQAQKYKKALFHFLRALEYPENLSVGRPKNNPRAAQIFYYIGDTYEALGKSEEARQYYDRAAKQKTSDDWLDAKYYQALAWQKLHRQDKAIKIFSSITSTCQQKLNLGSEVDAFAKFGEQQIAEFQNSTTYYHLGLGLLGKGNLPEAKEIFNKSVQLNMNNVWARYFQKKLF
jgi:tetratricopeptide (TPR) repeat protein